jgi:hypothetical protein
MVMRRRTILRGIIIGLILWIALAILFYPFVYAPRQRVQDIYLPGPHDLDASRITADRMDLSHLCGDPRLLTFYWC